jgi:hypothetical protein
MYGDDFDDDEKEEPWEVEARLYRIAQLRPAPKEKPKKDVVHTKMGTPCSPKWDDEWVTFVEKTEETVGHRCCGAHATDNAPCELESTSKNGRCRFHGGGLNVGAPKGNTNAQIHGLYAKRVQQCGAHCPNWNNCPYAGEDIKSLAESKRPNCFYETQEMDALRKLESSAHEVYLPLEDRWFGDIKEKPYSMYAQLIMLRENMNLLQVMISRAARALNAKGLVFDNVQQSDKYFSANQKPNALLIAHQMLSREHRLTLKQYSSFIGRHGLPKYEAV